MRKSKMRRLYTCSDQVYSSSLAHAIFGQRNTSREPFTAQSCRVKFRVLKCFVLPGIAQDVNQIMHWWWVIFPNFKYPIKLPINFPSVLNSVCMTMLSDVDYELYVILITICSIVRNFEGLDHRLYVEQPWVLNPEYGLYAACLRQSKLLLTTGQVCLWLKPMMWTEEHTFIEKDS